MAKKSVTLSSGALYLHVGKKCRSGAHGFKRVVVMLPLSISYNY